MSPSPGSRLGPYEIASRIGAGGMGEVWRARDPRLNREVAIKISAQQFTDRFEREAHAIASLNHPNICTLFDIGPNYLVMELIEGPTLAERIAEGPIPVEEALGIARQIGDALEAAHEKNIVHRDLKPGNIKIRPDGSVKVLDFGLAKAGGSSAEVSPDSPTMLHSPTQAGVILGTAAYMAPEQARGKVVDKRADIWSFGVVLHEMLTGRKLFEGEDLTDTLAAVVRAEPDLATAPEKVRRLLRRCLEKDPKKRLRDIGDAWELLDTQPVTVTQAPVQAQGRAVWLAWAAVAVLAVVAGGALWAALRSRQPVDRPLARLDVDLGADVALPSLNTPVVGAGGSSVLISPDGTRLVYMSGNPPKLFTQRLDQPKATALPGTDGAVGPFFSPDGQWVGFATSGKLKKIAVEGGAVVPLADVLLTFRGASWGEDGSIIVADASGLTRVPAGGGTPQAMAGLINGDFALFSPQILPGGKAVLFTDYKARNADTASIQAMTLADRHRKILVHGGTSPRYLATSNGPGYLVYTNKATLFAIPFDPGKLETRGTAVPFLDDVAHSSSGTGHLDFSRTGTLVYRKGGEDSGLLTVSWIEGAGKTEPLLAKPGLYSRPVLSPDGQRLALEVTDGSKSDIWVYDWQRDTMTRLTFTGTADNAAWSPDGRYIVFRGVGGMSVARSDGAGKPEALTETKDLQFPWSFTPDGKQLAFGVVDSKGGWDLWTLPVENNGEALKAGKPEVFLQTPANERSPSLSPDGRWLAYSSDESGTYQIYVRSFPDKGGKWQVSNSGGAYPMWSRGTHELFFETNDNQLMTAGYTVKGDSFMADKPRMWSERTLGGVNGTRNVTIAPDGKRIAALMPVAAPGAQQAQNQVVFVLNFFDELRRKVPAGK
jgi:Tol biopolymer transport system component